MFNLSSTVKMDHSPVYLGLNGTRVILVDPGG